MTVRKPPLPPSVQWDAGRDSFRATNSGIRRRFSPVALAATCNAWDGFLGRIAQHGRQNRMVEKKKAPAPKRGRRTPRGDRRQFLMMMSPIVIKAVKQAAIEDDRAAWDVMEEAAKQWLDRRKGRRTD